MCLRRMILIELYLADASDKVDTSVAVAQLGLAGSGLCHIWLTAPSEAAKIGWAFSRLGLV